MEGAGKDGDASGPLTALSERVRRARGRGSGRASLVEAAPSGSC